MGEHAKECLGWRAKYLAAILEVDNGTLLQKVTEAEAAVHSRLHQNPDGDELNALRDAVRGLGLLRAERNSEQLK